MYIYNSNTVVPILNPNVRRRGVGKFGVPHSGIVYGAIPTVLEVEGAVGGVCRDGCAKKPIDAPIGIARYNGPTLNSFFVDFCVRLE